MTTPNRPTCPQCGRTAFRLQRSGPKGSTPGDRGPAAVYPCHCWLTADEAKEIARGHLRIVPAGA